MAEVPALPDEQLPLDTTPEVSFALVLARLIEAAQNDPIQLRSAVYEAARHKLREQVADENPREARQLLEALETAIRGVEKFSQDKVHIDARLGTQSLPGSVERSRRNAGLEGESSSLYPVSEGNSRSFFRRGPLLEVLASTTRPAGKRFALLLVRGLVVVALGGGILGVVYLQRGQTRLAGAADPAAVSEAFAILAKSPTASKSSASATPAAVGLPGHPDPSAVLPTTFGVFAVSANQLHELDTLPGTAPDSRVAMSAAITRPAKVTVPEGRVRFVVHRRDSATNAVERAEVRVMARIERNLTYKAPDKPTAAKAEESWVIRNISYPYRAAPIKNSPDMYELRNEDPEFALPSGRYVLVIKGAAYDFVVRGEVTDPRQCLERTEASNGVFYTECRRP